MKRRLSLAWVVFFTPVTFLSADIHFGIGRAIRSEVKELSKEVGPSRDPILGLPYQSASGFFVNHGFSTTSDAPWGNVHDGLDVCSAASGSVCVSTTTLKGFIAAEDGTISGIKITNENAGRWQVNVLVTFNKTYKFSYAFETFSTSTADRDIQVSNIAVSENQKIKKGDLIGRLHAPASGAHVHFGFHKNNDRVCPESYFSQEARNIILASLQQAFPTATKLCYP